MICHAAAYIVAMYIGEQMIGSGMWAAVAVSVMGPRDSVRGGASFRVASLRINGTVCGSLWVRAFLSVVGFFLGRRLLFVETLWLACVLFKDCGLSVCCSNTDVFVCVFSSMSHSHVVCAVGTYICTHTDGLHHVLTPAIVLHARSWLP